MYNIGDYVVYGRLGVCKIDDICPSPFGGDDRQHYLLRPVDSPTSEVYTPVESDKMPLRALMTKDEAISAVAAFASVDELTVDNERHRRDIYKIAVKDNSPIGMYAVIKTVRARREQLAALRRHLTEADSEYEMYAKKMLYYELSIVLGMQLCDIEQYIDDIIRQQTLSDQINLTGIV